MNAYQYRKWKRTLCHRDSHSYTRRYVVSCWKGVRKDIRGGGNNPPYALYLAGMTTERISKLVLATHPCRTQRQIRYIEERLRAWATQKLMAAG